MAIQNLIEKLQNPTAIQLLDLWSELRELGEADATELLRLATRELEAERRGLELLRTRVLEGHGADPEGRLPIGT